MLSAICCPDQFRGSLTAAEAAAETGRLAALGATLRSGFDVVAEAVGLRERLAHADFVVTGEGKLDASSLNGKVVGGRLRRTTKPVAVNAGHVDVELDEHIQVSSLTERAGSPERAMREAAALVRSAASELATMAAHRGDQEPQTWHRRSR